MAQLAVAQVAVAQVAVVQIAVALVDVAQVAVVQIAVALVAVAQVAVAQVAVAQVAVAQVAVAQVAVAQVAVAQVAVAQVAVAQVSLKMCWSLCPSGCSKILGSIFKSAQNGSVLAFRARPHFFLSTVSLLPGATAIWRHVSTPQHSAFRRIATIKAIFFPIRQFFWLVL